MLRPKLNRVWTSNNANLRRDPGDAKYLQGWIAEIPTFQVLNYLQYKVDTTLLALAERGVFEWGADVQYGLGSLVWDDATQTVYVATVGSPSRTLRPSQNLGQWAASAIQVSRYDYDDIVSKISAHIADVTSNPHRLTANMIGAYNKAQIDSLVAQYNALVASHANDRDNPHKVTAVQAGAVPTTGGTYTGPVTFQQGMLFDASGTTKLSFGPDGFYMQSGDTRIGLDASGVPVVGKASTNINSRIITDAIFAEVKALEEPKYAVPEPILNMPLIGSINMRAGIGEVNSSGNEPTYAPKFGNALIVRHYASFGIRGTEEILAGGRQATLAIDTIFSGTPAAGNWLWDFGLGWFTILVTSNRNILCKIKGTGTVTISNNVILPMHEWVRIVATYNAATGRVCLYVNGVKAFDLTPSNLPTTGFEEGTIYNTASGAFPNISTYLRNFRVWADELTDKQISTL